MKQITDKKFDWAVKRIVQLMEDFGHCPRVYGLEDHNDCTMSEYDNVDCDNCRFLAVKFYLESGD